MAGKKQFPTKKFIKEIPGTHGNITEIANRVGCCWNTAKDRITNYPTVKKAYDQECAGVTDKARHNVTKGIFRGDIGLSKWWLQVKDAEFTPSSKHVLSGEGEDGTININIVTSDGS